MRAPCLLILMAALAALVGCGGWSEDTYRPLAGCSEARTCPPGQSCTPWGQCAVTCTSCSGPSCPECTAWSSGDTWQCVEGFCQLTCSDAANHCWGSLTCDLSVGLCRPPCTPGLGSSSCAPGSTCVALEGAGAPGVCRGTGVTDGGVGDGGATTCNHCPDGCCDQGICVTPSSRHCGTGGADCVACTGGTPVCSGGSCVAAPSSCAGLASTCGPDGNASCCDANLVPGGTYDRLNDPTYPATVSPFVLDVYEVTVGRFRAFVDAAQGTQLSPPAAGAGANPHLDASGWDPSWNVDLTADADAQLAALKCDVPFQTWTDAPGGNENRPMNCISWVEAFAFCIWDGGRLPTEAEWNFAAAGGSEQRLYPWSVPPENAAIDDSDASWECMGDGVSGCTRADFVKVGTKPAGNGRWGHADLAGNVWELVADRYEGTGLPLGCVDCANMATGARVIRGGADSDEANKVTTTIRWYWDQTARAGGDGVGVRCARTP